MRIRIFNFYSLIVIVLTFANAAFAQSTESKLKSNQQDLIFNELHKKGQELLASRNDSCLIVLNLARDLAIKQKNRRGLAEIYSTSSQFHQKNADYKKAQEDIFSALKIFEEFKDSSKIGNCYNNIGTIFIELGDIEKAVKYYNLAAKILLRSGDMYNYGKTCINIGAALVIENKYQNALEKFNLGLQFIDSSDNIEIFAHVLLNKGISYYNLNDKIKASNYFDRALNIYKKNKSKLGLMNAYFDIGYIFEMDGKLQEAIRNYTLCYGLAVKFNFSAYRPKPVEGLLLSHNALNNKDSVEHYYFLLAGINQELLQIKTDENLHDLEVKYQTEKKEQALALEKVRREKVEKVNAANKQMITYLFIAIGLTIFLIIGILFYQRQKQQLIQLKLQKSNDEIEKIIGDQQVKVYASQLEGETLERKRIASELHDRVGGLLSTLNLQFDVLNEKLNLKEEGDRIQNLIKASIDEVRTVSHNLHGIGQSAGLENALEVLRYGIDSSGKIEMLLFYEVEHAFIPELISAEIYKIVQELSTNTLKHAKANKISVQLSMIENVLHLIYEDDGKGFDFQTVKKGLGLMSMSARVENCSGILHVDSKPGRGTTIIINIPIDEN